MLEHRDYTEWTLEALFIEEKKLKKNETIAAVLIGVAIGILVYGVARKGFGFLQIFLPLALMYVFYKDSEKTKQKLRQIRIEINNKRTM